MQEFKLPDLGEGMQEAEIVEWLVKTGDIVKLDQTMVKVETDKALVEIPSPVAGRISEIRIANGQTARVGEVLIVFETTSTGSNPPVTNHSTTQASPASQLAPVNTSQPASMTTKKRVLASPGVRKLAFELGIELEQVLPTDPQGRISVEDVRAYAEQAKAPVAVVVPVVEVAEASEEAKTSTVTVHKTNGVQATQEDRQPLTGLRKRIAERMERSWRTIPHATSFDEVDGSRLIALRQALKPVAGQRGIRLTYLPILIKLVLPLLKEFPIFNASLDEERREIVYKHSYHIGIAADSPEGLLVPVLRDADRLSLVEIASKLDYLIEGAKKRTLTIQEVAGSTFTLNNVGSFGGSTGTPIINYPEAAILAVGRLQEKAIVEAGTIVVRPMLPLALSIDHRLIDGALSGKFLARFKEMVEKPEQLMLDMR